MIKIFHNPRCAKSRGGVAFLEEKGVSFEIVKYLDDPFTVESLSQIIAVLKIKPLALVRKNEADWKHNFKGKELSDSQVIQAMIDYPKLIERPIVINFDRAVVARPTSLIDQIL
ncbi:MAG: arsenate reductase (glutaredoxin) [Wenyingzhuangia sp.]|jgi:arsenate reductase (glutaredoxin)|uniref:arsenate reductase (glutaredoxin) n=1 Tax=Wenyingzhuangia sp. TaxID=1964193 RepID=UPI003219C1FA